MTMTVTGVTESVTPITVAVTITSRCRNTSHSAAPSHAPRHNRHGKPRKTAIPGTSEWGLSQPNHLRKRPTTYGSCQPQMGTFTASHHRTANQSTTNVDFHSRLGWLAADGLNYCRVSDNFRDKNDNFRHIRHGSWHQPAVVVTNPAEN